MVSDVTFHIEMFSTNMTFTTLSICIFTWKIHLRQRNVKSVENISRRNGNSGTPTKKNMNYWVPVWRFKYFRHTLQNPNLKLMSSFPNNHNWAYTFLILWALKTLSICLASVPLTRFLVATQDFCGGLTALRSEVAVVSTNYSQTVIGVK